MTTPRLRAARSRRTAVVAALTIAAFVPAAAASAAPNANAPGQLKKAPVEEPAEAADDGGGAISTQGLSWL
jgi:hypothetical protein